MGLESAHQSAVFTLGAEVGVDLPQPRLHTKFHEVARGVPGQFFRLTNDLGGVGAVWNVRHVDNVHVAQIIQLRSSRFSHPDNGEGDVFGRVPVMQPGNFQSSIERCRGHRSECFGDSIDDGHRRGLTTIPQRQSAQLPSIRHPQGHSGLVSSEASNCLSKHREILKILGE